MGWCERLGGPAPRGVRAGRGPGGESRFGLDQDRFQQDRLMGESDRGGRLGARSRAPAGSADGRRGGSPRTRRSVQASCGSIWQKVTTRKPVGRGVSPTVWSFPDDTSGDHRDDHGDHSRASRLDADNAHYVNSAVDDRNAEGRTLLQPAFRSVLHLQARHMATEATAASASNRPSVVANTATYNLTNFRLAHSDLPCTTVASSAVKSPSSSSRTARTKTSGRWPAIQLKENRFCGGVDRGHKFRRFGRTVISAAMSPADSAVRASAANA